MINEKMHITYLNFLAKNVFEFPYEYIDTTAVIAAWLVTKGRAVSIISGVYNIDGLANLQNYAKLPEEWWVQFPNGDILDYTYPRFHYAYRLPTGVSDGRYYYDVLFKSTGLSPVVKKGTPIWNKFIPLKEKFDFPLLDGLYDIAELSKTFKGYLRAVERFVYD